jgi:hypothetical protein
MTDQLRETKYDDDPALFSPPGKKFKFHGRKIGAGVGQGRTNPKQF